MNKTYKMALMAILILSTSKNMLSMWNFLGQMTGQEQFKHFKLMLERTAKCEGLNLKNSAVYNRIIYYKQFKMSLLEAACNMRNFDIVCYLIEKGANPNPRVPNPTNYSTEAFEYKQTLIHLHSQISKNSYNIAEYLLRHGAKTIYLENDFESGNQNVLHHLATLMNNENAKWGLKLAELYAAYGADPSLIDRYDKTPADHIDIENEQLRYRFQLAVEKGEQAYKKQKIFEQEIFDEKINFICQEIFSVQQEEEEEMDSFTKANITLADGLSIPQFFL